MVSFPSSILFTPYDSTYKETSATSRFVHIPIAILFLLLCGITFVAVNLRKYNFHRTLVLNLTIAAVALDILLNVLAETRILFPMVCGYSVGPLASIGLPAFVSISFIMPVWFLEILGFITAFFFRYPETCDRHKPYPKRQCSHLGRRSYLTMYYGSLLFIPLFFGIILIGMATDDETLDYKNNATQTIEQNGVTETQKYSCIPGIDWAIWFFLMLLLASPHCFYVLRVVGDAHNRENEEEHSEEDHGSMCIWNVLFQLILPLFVMFLPVILTCILYAIAARGDKVLISSPFYLMDTHLITHIIVIGTFLYHSRHEIRRRHHKYRYNSDWTSKRERPLRHGGSTIVPTDFPTQF